jgi:hypothetical protein
LVATRDRLRFTDMAQHNLIAWPEETNYHRMGNSVLTVCVSSGGRRKAW